MVTKTVRMKLTVMMIRISIVFQPGLPPENLAGRGKGVTVAKAHGKLRGSGDMRIN